MSELVPQKNRAESLLLRAKAAMLGAILSEGVGAIAVYEALGTTNRLDEIAGIMVISLGPALGGYAVNVAHEAGRLEAQILSTEIVEQTSNI